MRDEIKLYKCPCCSYSAVLETVQVRKGWEANIRCNDCGLEIHTITFDFEEEAIEDAVTKWNTRKPIDRIVESMEERITLWEDESVKDRVSAEKHIKTWNVAIGIVKAGGIK